MFSSSSDSSSESSSVPPPTKKRKQVEPSDSSDGPSDHDTASDTGSIDDDDAPQPLPPAARTVLSHAERRRQKKKEKQQGAVASSDSPRKKHKRDDGTADAPPASNVKDHAQRTSKSKNKNKNKAAPVADDPRRQRRQNSIWVGNLAFRTTEDALRAFFDGVGTITRVHMPMRRVQGMPGENMGYAYVDFETPDAKVMAITRSEGPLDGRNLLIKDGDDFTGRPAKAKTGASDAGGGESGTPAHKAATADGQGLSKTAREILRAQTQPPAPTLYLGNLAFVTTEASIRELFEAHRNWRRKGKKGKAMEAHGGDGGGAEGKDGTDTPNDVWIRKIRMATFEDSGNCKGFAFVDFTSIEHATAALINPRNHHLDGRDLVVQYASPSAVGRSGGGPRTPKGDQGRKGGAKAPRKSSTNGASHPMQLRSHRTEQEDGVEEAGEATTTTRSRRPDRTSHDRSHTRRAKPGAALAHAPRQSAAILPGQGRKTVF